jgi:hypothetical protein
MRKGTHKIKIWKPTFRKAEPSNTDDTPPAEGIATQISERGYRIERTDCRPAHGATYYQERRVVVRPDVADSQQRNR